jgi:alkylated DNA repair protein (DNA oxidative demethylase)
MTLDLFSNESIPASCQALCPGAVLLRAFAVPDASAIVAAVNNVILHAPFRHMVTPGGFSMSVAMTNCGSYGWVTDRTGYRYDAMDPQSGRSWPRMPEVFIALAHSAAAGAGFENFLPDGCLINRYAPGARLSLHQDKNERDYSQPIVSVSLGLPAIFLFGGLCRTDAQQRVPLTHGDVVVWGGPARMRYHGVSPLKKGQHSLLGEYRINLTFRKAA